MPECLGRCCKNLSSKCGTKKPCKTPLLNDWVAFLGWLPHGPAGKNFKCILFYEGRLRRGPRCKIKEMMGKWWELLHREKGHLGYERSSSDWTLEMFGPGVYFIWDFWKVLLFFVVCFWMKFVRSLNNQLPLICHKSKEVSEVCCCELVSCSCQ